MKRSQSESVDVLIVLMSLVAEGTPQLALQLARQWQQDGLRVEVMVMLPEPRDMQADFDALRLPLHWVDVGAGLFPLLGPALSQLQALQAPGCAQRYELPFGLACFCRHWCSVCGRASGLRLCG